jgi:hypothetical protein
MEGNPPESITSKIRKFKEKRNNVSMQYHYL